MPDKSRHIITLKQKSFLLKGKVYQQKRRGNISIVSWYIVTLPKPDTSLLIAAVQRSSASVKQ